MVLAEIASIQDQLARSGFAKRTGKTTSGKTGFVTEVGPVIASSVLSYFRSDAGRDVLDRLHALGIAPRGGGANTKASPLAGKTFVLTGWLGTLTRTEATERIRAQ